MSFSKDAFNALDVSPSLKSLVMIFDKEGFSIDFVRVMDGRLTLQMTKEGCDKSLPEFISVACPNPKTHAGAMVERREISLTSPPTHKFSLEYYLRLLSGPA
jgi:hypothetical protein